MDEAEVLAGVAEVLAQHFQVDPASVSRQTSAYDVDGWDSVSHVLVMLSVERRFAVKIPLERVLALEDVGDLVDVLVELRSGA
jgi:acyl carrier protein